MAGRKPTCKRVLDNGKKCNKPEGHASAPGASPADRKHEYVPPRTKPELDFSAIQVTKVTDRSKMAEFRRTRGERSKEQKMVDQLVRAAYDAWKEAGKPDDWADSFGMHVRVPAEQLEKLRDRAQNSAQHLGYAVRFGSTFDDGDYAETVLIARDRKPKEADAE